MDSLPGDMILEIVRFLEPADHYLLRETSRMFLVIRPPKDAVNLLDHGAAHGSIGLCEMGLARDHSPARAYMLAAERGNTHILDWICDRESILGRPSIERAQRADKASIVVTVGRDMMEHREFERRKCFQGLMTAEPLDVIIKHADNMDITRDIWSMLRVAVECSRTDVLKYVFENIEAHHAILTVSVSGCLETFEFVWGYIPDRNHEIQKYAVRFSRLDIFERVSQVCPPRKESWIYQILAEKGMTEEILKRRSESSSECPWDYNACWAAANRGDLRLFKILVKPVLASGKWSSYIPRWDGYTPGVFRVIQWMYAREIPHNQPLACIYAAVFGDLDALKWFIDHGYPVKGFWAQYCMWQNMLTSAHRKIDIQTFEFLLEHGLMSLKREHIQDVYGFGQNRYECPEEVIEWFTNKGYPPPTCSVYYTPVKISNLDRLKKLQRLGPPLDTRSWEIACEFGSPAMIEHVATSLGANRDPAPGKHLLMRGNLYVIQSVTSLGHRWAADDWVHAAVNGHLNVLEWMRARGIEMSTAPELIEETIKCGYPRVIEWIRENLVA